jgi:hypothetical protein
VALHSKTQTISHYYQEVSCRRRFNIAFCPPVAGLKRFSRFLKLLGLLGDGLYFKAIRRATGL